MGAARRKVVPAAAPGMVTLAEALAPYPVLSPKTLRALIAKGSLPATKVGKYLFVARADVDELFRPKLRAPQVAPEAEPMVPAHGLALCPSCGRMSGEYHRKVCGT